MESNLLGQIDRKHIWHPFTPFVGSAEPIFIKDAEGIYLNTADGRKIIDAISSWWVNLHGHSNREIAEAVAKQALTLEHVIFAGFTHEPAITLARNLLTVLPDNQSKLFFSDNGSTAVEVAIKIALQYWHNLEINKTRLIALQGAYHGDTFGSMSVGSRSAFTAAFEPLLFTVDFIDLPDERNFHEVLSRFESLADSGDVAAFIYEPLVQGANGMVMYSSAHLEQILEVAHRRDILCIADEVFTGFGRTGRWFASEYVRQQPDIMCVSKGITGGTLPLGVTSCSAQVVKPFISDVSRHTFFHGDSYTANPISCAAANASFEIMSRDETWRNIERIQQRHETFAARIGNQKRVKEVRHLGTILAVELATSEGTSYFNDLRRSIYDFFLHKNILLRPLGNIIYILPPYIISDSDLELIYSAIEQFLAKD